MEVILLFILIIAINAVSHKASNDKKKRQVAARAHQCAVVRPEPKPVLQTEPVQSKTVRAEAENFDSDEADEWDGSIEEAPQTPHTHEGKDASCPAEERAKPRPHPAMQHQEMPDLACDTVPGLTLNFSNSQSLVQGVIMSEVLRRPEFKNGRRVIH